MNPRNPSRMKSSLKRQSLNVSDFHSKKTLNSKLMNSSIKRIFLTFFGELFSCSVAKGRYAHGIHIFGIVYCPFAGLSHNGQRGIFADSEAFPEAAKFR